MARKFDLISELYERTCKTVVSNPQNWQSFLLSACRNYKLRFDEQILVYAQRPNATAVLEIERWNKSFGRWVNRGAKGIAVFEDANRNTQRLMHYFDISDTHEVERALPVPIWNMDESYEVDIIETLENTFGTLENKDNLAEAIISSAKNATEDNISDYLSDLIVLKEDSFLEELDEDAITVAYRQLITNSVAFMIMTRLNMDTELFFDDDDFRDVTDFNTQDTLNVLGYATSDIAEMGLAEIAKTVVSLDKRNRIIAENNKSEYNEVEIKSKRSSDYERSNIHNDRRLQSSEPDNANSGTGELEQIRTAQEEVPERASQSPVLQLPDEMQTDRTSGRSGTESLADGRNSDETDVSSGGLDRRTESTGYVDLGSQDEQSEEQSSGNRESGSDIQLEYFDRKNEDRNIDFLHRDSDIKAILLTTPHLKASKSEIVDYYETVRDRSKQTEFIKSVFNNDITELTLPDGRTMGYKTYQNVLHLWEGTYDNITKQGYYDWDVIAGYFEGMRLLKELTDTMKPLPSMEGQLNFLNETGDIKTPVFSFSQEIIDAVLTRGSGVSEGKLRIYEQFQKSLSKKENIAFLKNEYGWVVHIL